MATLNMHSIKLMHMKKMSHVTIKGAPLCVSSLIEYKLIQADSLTTNKCLTNQWQQMHSCVSYKL